MCHHLGKMTSWLTEFMRDNRVIGTIAESILQRYQVNQIQAGIPPQGPIDEQAIAVVIALSSAGLVFYYFHSSAMLS